MHSQPGPESSPEQPQIVYKAAPRVRSPASEREPALPSRVLHFRNLPSESTEQDLIQLCSAYGPVDSVLLMHQKAQALVQMTELIAAADIIATSKMRPFVLNSRSVYVQYSNWPEIRNKQHRSNEGMSGAQPSAVLHVTFSEPAYSVSIEGMHAIFAPFGRLVRIVLFTKKGALQCLVEFALQGEAEAAMTALHGHPVLGSTKLFMEYSLMNTLTVAFNNERSRDFTDPMLPYGPSKLGIEPGLAVHGMPGPPLGSPQWYSTSFPHPPPPPPGIPPQLSLSPALVVQQGSPIASLSVSPQTNYPYDPMRSTAVATSVLLVTKLHETRVTPDVLFTLLGVYGDVIRVKILFNKRDTALVQFATPQQALTAMRFLDGVPLFGQKLSLHMSHNTQVLLPREPEYDLALTRDFTNSPLHRFKIAHSKNYENICPPSSTLHLSNIPSGTPEVAVCAMFARYGTVQGFRFFPYNDRLALIRLRTLEEAVEALVGLHDHPMSPTQHLRVTFSKTPL